MNFMVSLDRKELDMLDIFWCEGRDLTHKEILNLVPKSISANAVYAHLNALIEKDFVEVGPSVRCGRTYGRTFRALITREAYTIALLRDNVVKNETTLEAVFSMFLGSENVTTKTLDTLEEKLRQKREELDG